MNTTEAREGWTPERIETLKTLWAAGNSCGQIARIMAGGLTRNAVIGKVTRMHLPKHAKNFTRSTPVRRHGNAGQTKAKSIVRRAAAETALPPMSVERYVEPDAGVDVTHLLGILDLTPLTCRYPHGDPLQPSFGFCGKQVQAGKPYCPEHYRRTHSTVEMNRAQAAQYKAAQTRVSTGDKHFGGAV